jgi:hypothetical protein
MSTVGETNTMGIFGEVGAVLDIYRKARESIEFVQEYEEERIRIRKPSFSMPNEEQTSRRLVSYIIEGTVDDTTAYPPGFKLVNVEEFVLFGQVEALYGAGCADPLDTVLERNERQDIRQVDEKYVSFQSIEEVEIVKVSESAAGPFEGDPEQE